MKFKYHAPLDPECPEVQSFMHAIREDPMSSECGCIDDVVESFEARHVQACVRCQDFGCANIEVVEG